MENKVVEEKKVWQVFACIGFGIGIGTIATFWAYTLPLVSGVPGIVFSALGMKSKQYHKKAVIGLILSIVGMVLSILFIILFFTLLFTNAGY